MIYGYARVSTEAQDLTSQLAQLKGAGCEKVFREKITGTTADRPQLRKLMAALAHGDAVIIPAVDRLSRDTTDLLIIAREMQKAGAGNPLTGRAVPRYDLGLRRDRFCDPWRSREAGTPPHRGTHRTGPRRRQGQRRQIRPQAYPHPSSAARSDQAARRGRRNAALDSPQLQCQPADDFPPDCMTTHLMQTSTLWRGAETDTPR
jgi:hypothetical protein